MKITPESELEVKQKELYLLFRDYNLLNREIGYLRNAIFMLEISKSEQGTLVAKELNYVLDRMYILFKIHKVKLEDKIGFLV